MSEEEHKPDLWECDRCDGVGWYEGGETLCTHCEICDGTGVVDKSVPTMTAGTASNRSHAGNCNTKAASHGAA